MSSIHFETTLDNSKLIRGIAEANQTVGDWAKSNVQHGLTVEQMFSRVQNAAMAYLSLDFAGRIGREIINVRGEFQQLGIAFEVMLGSKEKADKLMAEQIALAQKTPFTLVDVATNTKQLMAMGIGYEKVMQTMKDLGNVAAGVSVPISRVAINYGQVAALGKLQEREIRDFAMAGIPLMDELAKNMGKTKDEIQAMVTASKIGFPEVERAFQTMSGEGGKFYNLMEKQNASVTGQISNLTDKWQVMLNEIGKSNEGTIYGGISMAANMVANYQNVIDTLKVIAATYGMAKAATIVYNLVMAESAAVNAMVAASNGVFTKSLALQWLWTERAQKAQDLLNKSMLTNPYVLAAAAITTMIASIVVMNKRFEESIDAKKRFDEQTQSISDSYDKRNGEAKQLIETLTSETSAEVKRIEALNKLKELYPSIFGQIDIHNSKLSQSVELTKKVADEEAKRNLQLQREHITALINERDEFQKSMSKSSDGSAGMYQLGYDVIKRADDEKRIIQMNEQIRLEGERETKMIIDQTNAEQSKTQAIAKTFAERLKEANSIEKLTALQTELKSSFETATNNADRSKYYSQLAQTDTILTAMKGKTKEAKGEYEKLDEAVKKASDAVMNASEKERPALEEKLSMLVKQKQAWEDLIKAQRGETKGLKQLAITAQVSNGEMQPSVQLAPMKQLTDEQRKQLEAKAKQVNIEEKIKESEKERNELIQGFIGFVDETIQKYGEMLGLSEDQQDVLKDSVNAMKGIAQIATGNVIQGSFTLLASTVDMLVKAPEKMSVHYENVQKQIEKIISSIETANDALGNIGKDSSFTSLKIVRSHLYELAEDAKKLNEELANSSTGRRRDINLSLPGQDIVKQAADLNAEIEKLSNRLLKGDISDDQRKSIEALLDTYNSLVSEINSSIQDLTGTTVSEFGSALSDAIIDGSDAWDVWEQKATDVIRRVISKQLQSKFIEQPITEAINALVNDSTNGLTAIEASNFKDTIKSIYTEVGPAYQAAIDALKAVGIDITSASSSSSTASTGVSASITEETGSLIAGIGTAVRIDIKSILEIEKSILEIEMSQVELMQIGIDHLSTIEKNTNELYYLEPLVSEIKNMHNTLKEKL